jgi:dTDP-D-glucose 4,6-dehydratase
MKKLYKDCTGLEITEFLQELRKRIAEIFLVRNEAKFSHMYAVKYLSNYYSREKAATDLKRLETENQELTIQFNKDYPEHDLEYSLEQIKKEYTDKIIDDCCITAKYEKYIKGTNFIDLTKEIKKARIPNWACEND